MLTGRANDAPGSPIPLHGGDIDVVIVNWNSGSLLRECVASIAEYGDGVERIIVIDNASSDGSWQVADLDQRVDLVRNTTNLGFASACNQGAARGNARYVLFLNPDARLFPNALERTIAFLDEDAASDIGICGIKLIDDDGTVSRACARFPTPISEFGHATGLSKILPQLFKPLFLTDFDHETDADVDQVMGAFLMIRRAVFSLLDGFDERFFVYCEDQDLCLRAKEQRWRVHYFSDASAYHKGGGTTERVKATRLFYYMRSKVQYVQKHYTGLGKAVSYFAIIILEPLARTIQSVARISGSQIRETIEGLGRFYMFLPRLFWQSNESATAGRQKSDDS